MPIGCGHFGTWTNASSSSCASSKGSSEFTGSQTKKEKYSAALIEASTASYSVIDAEVVQRLHVDLGL